MVSLSSRMAPKAVFIWFRTAFPYALLLLFDIDVVASNTAALSQAFLLAKSSVDLLYIFILIFMFYVVNCLSMAF